MNPLPLVERRRGRRYIVSGAVRFATNTKAGSADLVNLGEGGVLIRSGAVIPEGTEGTFHVVPQRCPFEFEIPGRVVGVKGELMAIRFLQRNQLLAPLIQWLENEHYPWTGTIAMDALSGGGAPGTASKTLPVQVENDLEHERELVYQDA
jgi:hypothetical protein